MSGILNTIGRLWRCRSGATAVEFAIVCLPLMAVSLGIVEFGRALYIRSDLSHAADFAARKVLIGLIPQNSSESEMLSKVDSAVREAFSGGAPEPLQVSVVKETIDGAEFWVVAIQYPLTLLVPGLKDSPIRLNLSRRIPIA